MLSSCGKVTVIFLCIVFLTVDPQRYSSTHFSRGKSIKKTHEQAWNSPCSCTVFGVFEKRKEGWTKIPNGSVVKSETELRPTPRRFFSSTSQNVFTCHDVYTNGESVETYFNLVFCGTKTKLFSFKVNFVHVVWTQTFLPCSVHYKI